MKTFEIGARLEKVCAWNPRVEPGSSNSQSSPDSAAVRPAASQTGVKRSSASASSAGSAKRAHTNGRFSDSDDSSDNDSSDFGDDEVESRDAKLHWPEVQRLDLPLTVIPGQPDVKVVFVVRYNQDSFDDCNSPERHNKDMLAAIMGVLQPKIPLFTGQQVHARWVTLTGTLDTAVNNANPLGAANGFLGAIVRRARDAGFWVVRFTEDNKIHNFIPRKYVKLVNEPALSVDE